MANVVSVLELALPAPMQESIQNLLGLVNRRVMFQQTAASANVLFTQEGSPTVIEAGFIRRLGFVLGDIPASGESYSIDIKKSSNNGGSWATVLSGPIVINSANVVSGVLQTDMQPFSTFGITKPSLATGDMIRAEITYTAGGGPAPAATLTMFMDICPIQ